jgi:hypothetical protein
MSLSDLKKNLTSVYIEAHTLHQIYEYCLKNNQSNQCLIAIILSYLFTNHFIREGIKALWMRRVHIDQFYSER